MKREIQYVTEKYQLVQYSILNSEINPSDPYLVDQLAASKTIISCGGTGVRGVCIVWVGDSLMLNDAVKRGMR